MFAPMLATAATEVPIGSEWSYEPKWDGYRAIADKSRTRVSIYSRNLKDLTRQYPTIAAAFNRIKAPQVTLDGEIVALDLHGRPSFQALQHSTTPGLVLAYYAFDCLAVGGRDLTGLPLDARRVELQHLKLASPLLLSSALPGTAVNIIRAVKALGLEGIVAKRRDSLYHPGARSDDWIKVRFGHRQEFVVGGYRPNGHAFDALMVGFYEGGRLLYASTVKSGFTPLLKRALLDDLRPLQTPACPFGNLPQEKHGRWGSGFTADDMDKVQWVTPTLVVEVSFVEWTRDGALRHATFVSTRTDKPAGEVRRI